MLSNSLLHYCILERDNINVLIVQYHLYNMVSHITVIILEFSFNSFASGPYNKEAGSLSAISSAWCWCLDVSFSGTFLGRHNALVKKTWNTTPVIMQYDYIIANGILIETILKNIGRNAVVFLKDIQIKYLTLYYKSHYRIVIIFFYKILGLFRRSCIFFLLIFFPSLHKDVYNILTISK